MAALRARAPFALAVLLADLALYDAVQLVFFLRAGHYPDFELFWNAARAVLAHGPGAVYAAQPGAPWPYLNPPLLAWLLAPVALLPFNVAFGLWIVASAAALGWAARLCGAGWWGALSAAAFLPSFVALGSGQVAPLLVLALAGMARLEARDRWAPAGVLLAVAAVKPQLALLVPVALLAAGRWRAVALAAGLGVVVAALTVAALGPDGIRAWLGTLARFSNNPYFLRWSLVPVLGSGGWWVALAVAAVLVALAARRWRADALLVTGVGIVGSVLLNHYLTPSDLVVLLLPAWALCAGGAGSRALGGALWAAGWLALWLPWVLLAGEVAVLVALALPVLDTARRPRLVPATP